MLPGVYLHHLRHIERVDPGKRICRDENNSTVRIYFLLRVTKFYRLQDLGDVSGCADVNVQNSTNQRAHSSEKDS